MAMDKIKNTLPEDALKNALFVDQKPFFGICVGLQVLFTLSEEFGEYKGLNWIKGTVQKIDTKELPLPHIGWNDIICKKESVLLNGLDNQADFYFVHSYAVFPEDKDCVLATTKYGCEFCCAVQKDNLFGVQFHPEKSQKAGKKLIENFLCIES
jgi:glutamine amidotransferase